MKINNLPDYAKNKKFIVAREYKDEYYFWGAYDDIDQAIEAADNVFGEVFPTSESCGECEVKA